MMRFLRTASLVLLSCVAFCAVAQEPAAAAPAATLQEENARLMRENEALRRENQRLRRLVVTGDAAQRGGRRTTRRDEAIAQYKDVDCDYWLSTNSGARHNAGCRNFKKTRGRPCTKNEGKPCGLCGG